MTVPSSVSTGSPVYSRMSVPTSSRSGPRSRKLRVSPSATTTKCCRSSPRGLSGGMLASPASAGAVEDGPHQVQAGAFAGEPSHDLDPPAGLAEAAFDEVGVAD